MTQTLSKASHLMLWITPRYLGVLGFWPSSVAGSYRYISAQCAGCVSEWQEAQSNSERLTNGDDSFSSRNLKTLSECGARYWSRGTPAVGSSREQNHHQQRPGDYSR
jgi:hypothetical protein